MQERLQPYKVQLAYLTTLSSDYASGHQLLASAYPELAVDEVTLEMGSILLDISRASAPSGCSSTPRVMSAEMSEKVNFAQVSLDDLDLDIALGRLDQLRACADSTLADWEFTMAVIDELDQHVGEEAWTNEELWEQEYPQALERSLEEDGIHQAAGDAAADGVAKQTEKLSIQEEGEGCVPAGGIDTPKESKYEGIVAKMTNKAIEYQETGQLCHTAAIATWTLTSQVVSYAEAHQTYHEAYSRRFLELTTCLQQQLVISRSALDEVTHDAESLREENQQVSAEPEVVRQKPRSKKNRETKTELNERSTELRTEIETAESDKDKLRLRCETISGALSEETDHEYTRFGDEVKASARKLKELLKQAQAAKRYGESVWTEDLMTTGEGALGDGPNDADLEGSDVSSEHGADKGRPRWRREIEYDTAFGNWKAVCEGIQGSVKAAMRDAVQEAIEKAQGEAE